MAGSLELLASGFDFLEAPRVDADGSLYFADSAAVYRLDSGGSLHTVLSGRPAVGGIALHADGGVVISGRDLAQIRDGELRVAFALEGIDGFNDIFTDTEGRVYAGTYRTGEAGGSRPGELWRVESAGRALQLYDDVLFTNGIGLSPDGQLLYHADTDRRELIVHELTDNGRPTRRRALSTRAAPGLPDGLAVDEAGCIWVGMWEGGCVVRFTPDGRLDRKLSLPARRVTSLCFGVRDRRELTIVTCDHTEQPVLSGCIYRVYAEVAGLPVPAARI